MKILKFDHMHVKPKNFDKFNEKFQQLMGMEYMMNMPMPQYGTHVAYEPFPIGMEVFQVTDPNAGSSAKVADENEGVFTIAYKVENLEEAIKEMETIGWKMMEYIDNTPIIEALFDTKEDFGFYIELVQTPFNNMRVEMAALNQG